MMWIVAIVTMCIVLIAHHLGFIEKVYGVIGEVARCSMCSVFWVTFIVLCYYKVCSFEAIALSFFMAYLSNWVAIGMEYLSILYEIAWQRSKRQMRSMSKSKRHNK